MIKNAYHRRMLWRISTASICNMMEKSGTNKHNIIYNKTRPVEFKESSEVGGETNKNRKTEKSLSCFYFSAAQGKIESVVSLRGANDKKFIYKLTIYVFM